MNFASDVICISFCFCQRIVSVPALFSADVAENCPKNYRFLPGTVLV